MILHPALRVLFWFAIIIFLCITGLAYAVPDQTCTENFPFKIPGQINKWTELSAQGYDAPVSGIVYDGRQLWIRPTSGLSDPEKAQPLGIPLGGLGTGYIDFCGNGWWGQTSIFNDYVPPITWNCPALAIGIKNEVTQLTTRPIGNNKKGVNSIFYWGHFPVADAHYHGEFPVHVAVRAWSPFLPGDSENSNIPAAIMDVQLKSKSQSSDIVKLYMYFPGPALRPQSTTQTAIIPQIVSEINLNGFLLKYSENYNHSVFIGTTGDFSVTSVPSTIMFGNIEQTGNSIAQSVNNLCMEVSIPVKPGETKDVRLIIAWNYTLFRDSGSEPHWNHYSGRFNDAVSVARLISQQGNDLLNRVIAWQKVVYKKPDLPEWLKDCLINGFYSYAKNTLWVDNRRPDNWYLPQGFFSHSESFIGCPIQETMVCRMHGHLPTLFFWRELELSTLEAFRHYQLATGEIPFCFGHKYSLRDPRYVCQHPLNSQQYIQMVLRYYLRTKDISFLQRFLPSVRMALDYSKTLDYDQDGLMNDHSHAVAGEYWPANQFYDIWPWYGTSAYVAGTWLATLKCGEEIGRLTNDMSLVTDCRNLFAKGMQNYEQKLWTGTHYRLYNDPENGLIKETCLGNQLMGEWCARLCGMQIFPDDRIQKTIATIKKLNCTATEYGLVNGVNPEGRAEDTGIGTVGDHGKQIFIGENLCATMTMMYENHPQDGIEYARRMMSALFEKHCMPWDQHCLIRANDGGPAWGNNYYSDLVIWAVPMAFKNQSIDQFVGEGGLVDEIIKASKGN